MPSALEMTGVSHTFARRGEPVLDNLDLCLPEGRSLAVMGRSGSGKSTLMSLALGLFDPTVGRVSVLGTDWSTLSAARRAEHRSRHVGVVFQQGELIDELTPLENVLLPALWSGIPAAQARARAEELLDTLRVRTSAPTTAVVSGGERQRIAVARALVGSPALLLADEPTGALDDDTAAVMADLLFSLPTERGCALLVVTHSRALAERADDVLTLTTPDEDARVGAA